LGEPVRNNGVLEESATARPRLLNFIRKRVGSAEDAEDILQDVYYQLAAHDSITEPIERITAWLFTAAKNRIVDWYRRKRPGRYGDHAGETRNETDQTTPVFVPALEEIIAGTTENSPERMYLSSAIWEEFEDALEDLPDPQREVFEMHELEGRSFKEIAAITGENINTLLSRKRYAVLFLRGRLAALYKEIEND
jgi:RNA polymerase sigma factor (sigma-70 family)